MPTITITTTPQDLPEGTHSIQIRQANDLAARLVIRDKVTGEEPLDYDRSELARNDPVILTDGRTYQLYTDLEDGKPWIVLPISRSGEPL